MALNYDGQWRGYCSAKAHLNYYTSSIGFGDFIYSPFIYVLYRSTNGVEDTGTIQEMLPQVTPSMIDKVNHKEAETERLIGEGRLVVDNKPWT